MTAATTSGDVKQLRDQFRSHLAGLGFHFGTSTASAVRRLAKALGPRRYQEYQRLAQEISTADDEAQNRLWDFARGVKEANLIRSIDGEATLATSLWLYRQCLPVLAPGMRVLELGCLTGGLASFIAANHPGCEVVGVDRLRRVIDADDAHYSLPNLRFQCWDYRQSPPDDLGRFDVLLCGLGINNLPGVRHTLTAGYVRGSAGHRAHYGQALPHFESWRAAARDGAWLFAALRVTSFAQYLAFVDAARQAGWGPWPPAHCAVAVRPGDVAAGLGFVARPSPAQTEDEVLTAWLTMTLGGHELAQFQGPMAQALYRALNAKEILGLDEYVDRQGVTVKVELGVVGAFGYVFGQDDRAACWLKLTSIPAARSQATTTPAQLPPDAFTSVDDAAAGTPPR